MVTEAIARWLEQRTPADVLLLTGAGVSANEPTALPLGGELLSRAIDRFFDPTALDEIMKVHAELGLNVSDPCLGQTNTRPPRLETVLDVAAVTYGPEHALGLLADFRDAPPNQLHAVLAGHLEAGGFQLTTNFDDCIERAAAHPQIVGDRVWHLHGSLAQGESLASLGATLRAIETGFSAGEADRLREALRRHSALVVLGYSGSDFFDVDSAVAELTDPALRNHAVLWVAHHRGGSASRRPLDRDPQLVRLLENAGADVTVLCASTSDVCQALATEWGIHIPNDFPALAIPRGLHVTDGHRKRPRPPGSPPTTVAARTRATFNLYLQLRLHRHARKMLADARLQISSIDLFRAEAQIMWDAGEYATLARRWWMAPSEIPRWERSERIGACLWEQGRLIPAYLWLTRHSRRLCANTSERLKVDETTARVVLQMHRSPDTRWLARRVRPLVQARLREVTRAEGLDTFRRANDVVRQLATADDPSPTANDARTSSLWFLEAGDLAALLAYRYSYYRRSYRSDIPTPELEIRYRKLQADKARVGSADARVMHLPGAERVYSVREFVPGLFAVQFAPWHRVRLLGRFLLTPAWHRLGTVRRSLGARSRRKAASGRSR